MNFFQNCCPKLWDKRYLPTPWLLGLGFKPPTLLLLFIFLSSNVAALQLTLNLKAVPLETAFAEIKKQSGYGFWYEKKDLADLPKVTVNLSNADLKTTLEACLKGQPLTYQIFDQTIVVKRKAAAAPVHVPAAKPSQDKVRGKVVDAQTKEPLAGVLVKVKEPARSAVTDDKGMFELALPAGSYELMIQYLGYATKETVLTLPMAGELVIALDANEQMLREVELNAGYYTVKDRERTGSISRVTSAEIGRQPVNNVLAALSSTMPGLQVTQQTGVPGGGFTVLVRGENSLKKGNEPFYVVDGVPFVSQSIGGSSGTLITPNVSPLASLNPLDIESIEVLKDADATAIYGSRGANGVVLITTKRGAEGKARASVSMSQGIARVGHFMDLMDTEEYVAMRREALANDGLSAGTLDYDINGRWDLGRSVDWQQELIGGSAPMTTLSGSLSGGAGGWNFLFGGTYYREGTVYPGSHAYSRASGNMSLGYKSLDKRFSVGLDATYSQVNSDLFTVDLTQYVNLAPNYPALLDSEGLLNWEGNTMQLNPLAISKRGFESGTGNLVSSLNLGYRIVEGLNLSGRFGYTMMSRSELSMEPLVSFSPALGYGPAQRASKFANSGTRTWIFEPQVSYVRDFGTVSSRATGLGSFLTSGKLEVLLGMSLQESVGDLQDISASGYTSDALMGNIAAASTLGVVQRSYNQYRYQALFGRVAYSMAGRYFVNLTGRRDGSSRFGPGRRYANFGAVGLGWIVSGEKWFEGLLPRVNFFKLRGSYGLTGNDQISDYGFMELWRPTVSYQGVSTLSPSSLFNPDFGWEKSVKSELGLDLGLLRDRISLSVGYYSVRSSNQLLARQLPTSTGFASLQDNLDATVRNWGWEFSFTGKILEDKKFSWTVSGNLSIPRNRLVSYPGLSTSGSDATRYIVGQPTSIARLYNVPVNPATGVYAIEDHDGNGTIDDRDRYVVLFRGRRFYGGLQQSFRLGGFTLDIDVQLVRQYGTGDLVGFGTAGRFLASLPTTNQLSVWGERWRNAGDAVPFQKFSTSAAARTGQLNATVNGTQAVGDASFVRLRNVSLGYVLPTGFAERLGMGRWSLFLRGQNLWTWTGYRGLDPETQSNLRLPPLQVFTAGMDLTF